MFWRLLKTAQENSYNSWINWASSTDKMRMDYLLQNGVVEKSQPIAPKSQVFLILAGIECYAEEPLPNAAVCEVFWKLDLMKMNRFTPEQTAKLRNI